LSAGRDFWSRRKAAVEAEADAEARQRDAAQRAEERAELAQKSDAEILAELNLQDPDTLEPGDDFAAFLQSAVPERLRRRALRRLWRSNPVLANLDDLVDYGEDYSAAANVTEKIQTAYQVGKGMLLHVQEPARLAELDAVGEAQPDSARALDERGPVAQDEAKEARDAGALANPAETAVADTDAGADADTDTDADADAGADAGIDTGPEDIAPDAPPVRRRMRFHFDVQGIADNTETPAHRRADTEEGK